MRELRSYRDPYTGNHPKQAFFGPYRRPGNAYRVSSILLAVAYVVITVLLITGAI